jgi:D-3-phosphoglycerate dehydrogenase
MHQTVGIIGTGRVGRRVLKHLQGFVPDRILVNDLKPDPSLYELYRAEHVSKKQIYREADILTLHVPLNSTTRNLVAAEQLSLMKPTAVLINTARGGIVNEDDLYAALSERRIAGAAVDVFAEEPYGGRLVTLDNCCLTCHMGSCTSDCRYEMELLATEEAVRYVSGEDLKLLVPEEEYQQALS